MGILKNQIKENFSQIPNELITDTRISIQARMVYVYVSSKPSGWVVCNTDVKQSIGIKDDKTMAKYWKELQDFGWLTRTKATPNNAEKNGTYNYILNASPILGNFPILGKNGNIQNLEISKKRKYPKNGDLNNKEDSNNTELCSNTEVKKIIKEKFTATINALYHRRQTTEWSEKELKALDKVIERKDAEVELEEIKEFYIGGYRYRRRDILTLLNNWTTELDRAMNRVDDQPPKPINVHTSIINDPVWSPDERGLQKAPWED